MPGLTLFSPREIGGAVLDWGSEHRELEDMKGQAHRIVS